MRLPKRRSQLRKTDDQQTGNRYMTPEGIERLKRTLEDLERRERPSVVEDLRFALTLGDFSENAEYQDAKHRLSRLDGRIFSLKERIKNAIPIRKDIGTSGVVRLGATVVMNVNGMEKTYQIVGPHESNPSRGRISHLSPLGSALLGHAIGETVTVRTEKGDIPYRILEVR